MHSKGKDKQDEKTPANCREKGESDFQNYHIIAQNCHFHQQNHKSYKEKGKHGPFKWTKEIDRNYPWGSRDIRSTRQRL